MCIAYDIIHSFKGCQLQKSAEIFKKGFMAVDLITKLKEWRADFELYARQCIKIKDHNTASIVPLILNRGQRILHAVAEKQKREKGYVRILLLKSRRFGGSTYVEGRFYWLTSLNFNRHTFIVGHESDSTSTLYRMAQLMQEQNAFAPSTKASNAQELIFDKPKGDGLKSQYRLATAGNVDAGRSQGVHYLHDSEEAFWRDADTLLTGLLQCVPDPPAESEVFRESTANGFGNQFQKDVFSAYCEGKYPYYEEGGITYAWHNPEKDWILVFIPWFVHDRYMMAFDSEEKKKAFAARIEEKVFNRETMKWEDSEEKKLKEKFGITLEQLNWRQWTITNKCNGSVAKFNQEYPATVSEAFLTKGSNVFGKTLCDDLEKLCRPPILTGELIDRAGVVKVRPTTYGKFQVWETPDAEEDYFITVDAGGGKRESQGEEKDREPDPTSIDVWNSRSGKQVAQWHGHIDYDMIDEIVEMIGQYYGRREKKNFIRPIAVVELNNHGYAVVANLAKRKYPMYESKPGEPGFFSNKRTKPLMVDDLCEMSRDGGLHIMCKETVAEMRTFIELNGKFGAASGCNDDRVITAALASQMYKHAPFLSRKKRKRSESVGFANWDNKNKGQEQSAGSYIEVRVA